MEKDPLFCLFTYICYDVMLQLAASCNVLVHAYRKTEYQSTHLYMFVQKH